jgi:chemotaxis protein methyltransferase CheR
MISANIEGAARTADDNKGAAMIQLSDSDFTRLTGFLKERFGINLIKKRTLIESRLNNYLVSNGFDSYKTYLDYALSDKTGAEVSQMLNYLTTNYSYFMREWEHFKFLKEHVLPEMAQIIKNNDLRTWSAGCSTGQEPYAGHGYRRLFVGERPEMGRKSAGDGYLDEGAGRGPKGRL